MIALMMLESYVLFIEKIIKKWKLGINEKWLIIEIIVDYFSINYSGIDDFYSKCKHSCINLLHNFY